MPSTNTRSSANDALIIAQSNTYTTLITCDSHRTKNRKKIILSDDVLTLSDIAYWQCLRHLLNH